MGCHMWLYKKTSSLTYDEQLSIINKEYKSYCHKIPPKEEYIKELQDIFYIDFEEAEILVKNGELSTESEEYKVAKQWIDPEFLANEYEKDCEKQNRINSKYPLFICRKQATLEDFIELHLLINDSSAHIKQHNGEWYICIGCDTYFRNYHYGEEPIDNYEDMIKYLESTDSKMTHLYGTFDENGIFHYYNDDTYEHTEGVTDELKDVLKYLYKDNDIFIEFG